jgi:hypothetical protein
VAVGALAAALFVPRDAGGGIKGVRTFRDLSRSHVLFPIQYPQTPPVGGDHHPVPQTCGFYTEPVPNENAVHSLEHGAVWITYRPGLPDPQLATLRRFARQEKVLVSPFEGLPSAVVATAWGRQLRLSSAADPRLERFVDEFRDGSQAPERGAPCRGVGRPAA